MRKSIVFSVILVGLTFLNSAHANDENIKLKKSCIRDYPQAAGQTDQALLSLYAQVCDKKNADRKNDLLAQAAMRFHQIGQNMNALYLVNQLKQQNVRGNLLTDVTFLSSVAIANTSLKDMRNTEMRFLTEDTTYPPAKELADAIKSAVPAPDTSNLKPITDESLRNKARAQRVAATSSAKRSTKSTPKPKASSPAPAKPAAPASKSSASPFDSLK